MDTDSLFDTNRRRPASIVLLACLVVLVGAVVTASLAQRDFGRVEVTNVTYDNFNGISIRAKLLRPVGASSTTPISTWFYQLTGKIYLGALVNAALVTWMFTSSQVIAPIPV